MRRQAAACSYRPRFPDADKAVGYLDRRCRGARKPAAGAMVPAHVHAQADDNLHILSGKTHMGVEQDRFKIDSSLPGLCPASLQRQFVSGRGGDALVKNLSCSA